MPRLSSPTPSEQAEYNLARMRGYSAAVGANPRLRELMIEAQAAYRADDLDTVTILVSQSEDLFARICALV